MVMKFNLRNFRSAVDTKTLEPISLIVIGAFSYFVSKSFSTVLIAVLATIIFMIFLRTVGAKITPVKFLGMTAAFYGVDKFITPALLEKFPALGTPLLTDFPTFTILAVIVGCLGIKLFFKEVDMVDAVTVAALNAFVTAIGLATLITTFVLDTVGTPFSIIGGL